MKIENYLQKMLTDQDLSPEQEKAIQAQKTEVTNFLRTEFGPAPTIKYAGSHEKGTIIAEQYDLDVVCYFPSSDERSLKEIREDVAAHLKKNYLIESKASAERILNLKDESAPDGYHIDVVPGRFIEGSKDVFLHVAYGEKQRLQTNLKTHIDHVANSGCVPVIRLAKLWAHRNNIAIRTFVLELFVIESLNGSRDKGDLVKSFRQSLEALRDKFGECQLVDPANSNNIVSELISSSEKTVVSNAASVAFDRIGESDDVEDWSAVFCDENASKNFSSANFDSPAIIKNNPSQGFQPHSPWSTAYVDRK